MLDGHDDLLVPAAQVQIAVPPGVQLTAPAQGLPGPGRGALAGMMDQQDGAREAALDVAQEAEDGGDLGDGVLVDAVQAHERVEDDEPGPDALDRLHQALAVRAMVEAQRGHVDDGDVEGLEPGAGGARDALEAGAHDVPGVLGGKQQDRAGLVGDEAAQAGHAGGDRDGEVQREEGLAALGFAADDTDRLAPPQRVDEPLPAARAVFELGRGARREAVCRRTPGAGPAHGLSSSMALWRWSALTVLALSRAAADSA